MLTPVLESPMFPQFLQQVELDASAFPPVGGCKTADCSGAKKICLHITPPAPINVQRAESTEHRAHH